jgi:uncharacterized membrane protein
MKIIEAIKNIEESTRVKEFKEILTIDLLKHFIWTVLSFLSTGLFLISLYSPTLVIENLSGNRIPQESRDLFFSIIIIFVLLGCIIFLVVFSLEALCRYVKFEINIDYKEQKFVLLSSKGTSRVNIVEKLKWLRILVILFLLPIFLDKEEWRAHTILYLGLLSGAAIFAGVYFNDLFQTLKGKLKPAINPQTEKLVTLSMLGVGVIFYAWYVTYMGFIRFEKFLSYSWDMGIYVNGFWHTLFNNNFMDCVLMENGNYLGSHFELTHLIFIGPFFYLFPTAKTLIVIGTIMVALGAIPIYLIANQILQNRWIAVLVSYCYLLNPALHSSNMWDFHEVNFFPLFLGLAVYFLMNKRFGLFYILLPFFLLLREDMALIIILISLFFMFYQKHFKNYLITIVICLVYFAITNIYLMPYFGDAGQGSNYGFGYRFEELIPFGKNPSELVKSLFINPVFALKVMLKEYKIIYFFLMMLPVLFLPLLRMRYSFFYLYGFAITMLSTTDYMGDIAFQYPLYWIPGIYIATILVLGDIQQHRIHFLENVNYKALMVAIIIATIIVSYQYGLFLNNDKFKTGWHEIDLSYTDHDKERYKAFNKAVKEIIPEDAIVSTEEFFYPHLAAKRNTYFNKHDAEFVDYVVRPTGEFQNEKYLLIADYQDYGFVFYKKKPWPDHEYNQSVPAETIPVEEANNVDTNNEQSIDKN